MTDNQKKFWDELKQKHPDALLLFRCGDFYVAYCDDANVCAKILGITLTWRTPTMRHKPGDYSDAMAGFPHHALDSYLPKLLRAGKRVAICDWPTEPPKKKRGITETINENQNSETMANEVKAADLIGKTIVIVGTKSKYVVKGVSADGETLETELHLGDGNAPMSCPMPMSVYNARTEAGKLAIEGGAQADHADNQTATATETKDDVEEVQDIKPEAPKPQTTQKLKVRVKTSFKEKGTESKKQENTSQPNGGRYVFKTYTRPTNNGSTKTLGRIDGFAEGDELLERSMADKLHASAMFDRNDDGTKTWWLSFGRRYVEAGRKVCEALNAGKSIEEMQAIVDAQTDENRAKVEEWRAKREQHNSQSSEKVYTETEVRKAFQTLADASGMDVKEFEPIIEAMKAAA